MKKVFLLTLTTTFICSYLMAQDGSNMRYLEPDELDSSFVGKYCHIDFGENSFGGRVIDTIEINVYGQSMKFYEHRADNGYDNWFRGQYLIRVEERSQFLTHLKDSRIDSLTSERIVCNQYTELLHRRIGNRHHYDNPPLV